MEKDKIFFGENGITTTSANHIANIAKESYRTLEEKLSTAVFYTTEISLLGSSAINTLKEGVNRDFLREVEQSLMTIAKLKSLIAWLREAIKAKERLIKEVTGLKDAQIAEYLNIQLPEAPETYIRLTEDDVVASWNIKQRNRYYYLDTVCSTIGKYIHPDMKFSNAKDDLVKIMSERNIVKGSGRDTVIYSYTPTVSIEDVEDTFFKLQNHYRSYQAELNSMKHQIEVALQEDDREKSQKELEEARNYQNECKTLLVQIVNYRKDMIRTMQSLKIIIPDSLKSIYEEIAKVGK